MLRVVGRRILALVAELIEHKLLFLKKLTRLVLESCGAAGSSTTIKDWIRRVKLATVLLYATLLLLQEQLRVAVLVARISILLSMQVGQIFFFLDRLPICINIRTALGQHNLLLIGRLLVHLRRSHLFLRRSARAHRSSAGIVCTLLGVALLGVKVAMCLICDGVARQLLLRRTAMLVAIEASIRHSLLLRAFNILNGLAR